MTTPKKILLTGALILLLPLYLTGKNHHLSIGTNTVGYLHLFTPNLNIGMSINRHWSLHLEGRYNPFLWDIGSRSFQEKQLTAALNTRYWNWYAYSGWFYEFGFQYSIYNRGGLLSPRTEEGQAMGLDFQVGYSLMLNKWTNLELGLGGWGGFKRYRKYDSPRCGKLTESGSKLFILPNTINVSLVFIL